MDDADEPTEESKAGKKPHLLKGSVEPETVIVNNDMDPFYRQLSDSNNVESPISPKELTSSDMISHTNGCASDGTSTENEFHATPSSQKRPSISQRRNFNVPLSAPHNLSTFGGTSFDTNFLSGGDAQRPHLRKTSLPIIMRPAELDLPSDKYVRCRSGVYDPTGATDDHNSENEELLNAASIQSVRQSETLEFRETENIVQSFMMYTHQRVMQQMLNNDDGNYESLSPTTEPSSAAVMTGLVQTPDLPKEFNISPLSPSAEVGRRLALLADAFDKRYSAELDDMTRIMLPHILGNSDSNQSTWALAFEAFRRVARRIFDGAQVTWGRIVALLSFGYRLLLAVLKAGLSSVVSRIVNFVSRFMMVESITSWVSRQGGWNQALCYDAIADSPYMNALLTAGFWCAHVTVAAILILSWLNKR